ncbi:MULTISPECIES: AIPR family protein [Bacillus]|uniref:AIPR family protein n=1 Tax=Bacillus TaxID=1386 RepID=UPI00097651BC|nr:AIPR family protein [Bacillus thuringiensis]OMH25116.1 hypothetical protein BUM91_28270 [Bacillus thuringiensis]
MSNQLILLNEVLKEYGESGGFNDLSVAFEHFATEQIFKNYDIGIDEVEAGLSSGSKDGGVDGVFLFLNEDLIFDFDQVNIQNNKNEFDIYLIQFKNTSQIEELVLDRFNGNVDLIFDLEQNRDTLLNYFNEEFVEKILLIHQIWRKIGHKSPTINVNFIHACKGNKTKTLGPDNENKQYINKIKILENKVLKMGGKNFKYNYEVLDAEWLLEASQKQRDYSLELKLNESPIGIDYLNEKQTGYMASVNIGDYYKFLCEEDGSLRKYLFESNIRDYQNKTAVNNLITHTLNKEEKYDFWWLNNGVTIIASKSSLVGKTMDLQNVQIVNGLQTSHTIYNVLKNKEIKEDPRSLMLKIIVTEDKETMDAIIKATNSQNPVSASSLRASDKVQRQIEEYLLKNGYYYDRRKNYYKNQGKPRKLIISISYMSQCLMSLLHKDPSKARSNPTTLLKNKKDYQKLFSEGRQLEVYFKSVGIMKIVEQKLKDFSFEDTIEEQIKNNFRFHVGRILVSYLLNKEKYNDKHFLNLQIECITDEKIADSIKLLKAIINSYQKQTGKSDLINISKTTDFSEYISKNILTVIEELQKEGVV